MESNRSYLAHLSLLILVFLGSSCQQKVKKTFIEQTNGYSQAVMIEQGSVKTLHISGQFGDGEDFADQMRSALGKIEAILKAQGGDFKDIVKMNWYIVDYDEDLLVEMRSIRKELMGDTLMPASTLVGVDELALEDWLIEIDAVAVIVE